MTAPRRRPHDLAWALALAGGLAGCAGHALADPGYYVVTPYADEGRRFVDLRYWTVKFRGGREVVWPEAGLGFGVTRRWTSILFASNVGPKWDTTRLSTWNWQNDVLLTGDDAPFDLALHTQLVRAAAAGERHTALEFGPVLQAEHGLTQFTGNLVFDRPLGSAAGEPTQLKFRWQVRHRVAPALRLGVEGFSELGPWDDPWPGSRQSHRAGPAAYTTLPLGSGRLLRLQGAALWGKTYGQRGHMATLRATLDF